MHYSANIHNILNDPMHISSCLMAYRTTCDPSREAAGKGPKAPETSSVEIIVSVV